MSWTLVTNSGRYVDNRDAVTVRVNSTNANLLLVVVGWYQGGGGSPICTDSIGAANNGTPTESTEYGSTNRHVTTFRFEAPANVGANHDFTVTPHGGAGLDGQYLTVDVYAITCSDGVPHFDTGKNVGASNNTGAAQATGSVTPSVDGCLIITAACSDADVGPAAPPSGYTAGPHTYAGVNTTSLDSAYLIQTTAAATNPSWDWHLASNEIGVTAIVFKPGTSSGLAPPTITDSAKPADQLTIFLDPLRPPLLTDGAKPADQLTPPILVIAPPLLTDSATPADQLTIFLDPLRPPLLTESVGPMTDSGGIEIIGLGSRIHVADVLTPPTIVNVDLNAPPLTDSATPVDTVDPAMQLVRTLNDETAKPADQLTIFLDPERTSGFDDSAKPVDTVTIFLDPERADGIDEAVKPGEYLLVEIDPELRAGIDESAKPVDTVTVYLDPEATSLVDSAKPVDTVTIYLDPERTSGFDETAKPVDTLAISITPELLSGIDEAAKPVDTVTPAMDLNNAPGQSESAKPVDDVTAAITLVVYKTEGCTPVDTVTPAMDLNATGFDEAAKPRDTVTAVEDPLVVSLTDGVNSDDVEPITPAMDLNAFPGSEHVQPLDSFPLAVSKATAILTTGLIEPVVKCSDTVTVSLITIITINLVVASEHTQPIDALPLAVSKQIAAGDKAAGLIEVGDVSDTVTAVLGDLFQDGKTESAKPVDTVTAVLDPEVTSLTDSATPVDTVTASLNPEVAAPGTESATPVDTVAISITPELLTVPADSAKPVDTVTAVLDPLRTSLVDSATPVDTATVVETPLVATPSEGVTPVDTVTPSLTPLVATLSESAKPVDTLTVSITPLVVTVGPETATPVDTVTALLGSLAVTLTESAKPVDGDPIPFMTGGGPLTVSNIDESAKPVDTVTPLMGGVALAVSNIDESAKPVDSVTALRLPLQPATLGDEHATPTDTLAAYLTVLNLVVPAEGVTPTDVRTVTFGLALDLVEHAKPVESLTLAMDLNVVLADGVRVVDAPSLQRDLSLAVTSEGVKVTETVARAITPIHISLTDSVIPRDMDPPARDIWLPEVIIPATFSDDRLVLQFEYPFTLYYSFDGGTQIVPVHQDIDIYANVDNMIALQKVGGSLDITAFQLQFDLWRRDTHLGEAVDPLLTVTASLATDGLDGTANIVLPRASLNLTAGRYAYKVRRMDHGFEVLVLFGTAVVRI